MATVDGTVGNDFIHVAGDGQVAPAGYNEIALATDTDDTINPKSGDDIIFAGGGADSFGMASYFTAADQIDGGDGDDKITLNGDYSGANAVTFGAKTLVNVETLLAKGNFQYVLTSDEATVANNQLFTVDASALTAGGRLTFNGALETDGRFSLKGSIGDDSLTGGAKNDTLDITKGGIDTVFGRGGADLIKLGTTMTKDDKIDGGGSTDTVSLNGDYTGANALLFNAATMINVETLQLTAGHAYNLTFNTDETIAAGKLLTIDGSTLGAADTLYLSSTAETDGRFTIVGGAGADEIHLSKGGLSDTNAINGGDGADQLWLDGGFEAGVIFNASTMTYVEKMFVAGANEQKFTLADNTIAAGKLLTVTRFSGSTADGLWLDASAESDGSLTVFADKGSDTIFGGAKDDYFSMSSGTDYVWGGYGEDVFNFGAGFDQLDTIDGSQGYDRLKLDGDYAAGVNFTATTMQHIEEIDLAAGHSYRLAMVNANIDAGTALRVDGSGLGNTDVLKIFATGETDSQFNITGGGADDTFALGSGFSAVDKLDGGAGNDTLELAGGNAGAVVFNATTISNIETIDIDAGGGLVNLKTVDASVASGKMLTIDYSAGTGANDHLFFNGSLETNATFTVWGTSNSDTITTGSGTDIIKVAQGTGNKTVHANYGSDDIYIGNGFSSGDIIDGAGGYDTLYLTGNYTLNITASMMTGIDILNLSGRAGQAKFTLTTNNANVAAGESLTVDAQNATWLVFDGSAETNGRFAIYGSKGDDTITTGTGTDTVNGYGDYIWGGLGHDDIASRGGPDTFAYHKVAESTGQSRDLLRDFIASTDKFEIDVEVNFIESKITTGTLNEGATFNAGLVAAVGAAKLGSHSAVIFQASAGTLANHAFLIVDANGQAGYQANADYVMEINNPGIIGTLTTGNFL